MFAMFLTIKASPSWKFKMCEGLTRESAQANTKNCNNNNKNLSFN